VLEPIEEAGIHSGDSACAIPAYSLKPEMIERIKSQSRAMAQALRVRGLMNVQWAIRGDELFVIEVNPRASRTVPFVSKAIGVPLAKIAAKTMVGEKLVDQGFVNQRVPEYYSVKEAVFPFIKFPGSDPILGPEMKSTGEVMGIGRSFGEAYAKAQLASGVVLPRQGVALLSIRDRDKEGAVELARILVERGFEIVATHGTAQYLASTGVLCRRANKVREGRPHIVDMIKNDEIVLIVNTTEGRSAIADSYAIRREALMHAVCYTTTISGGNATCQAMEHREDQEVYCLQTLHQATVQ